MLHGPHFSEPLPGNSVAECSVRTALSAGLLPAVRMPEISRFLGIVIRMYYEDHEPPHFHASYSGIKARIRIEPPGLLHGKLSPRVLAILVEWASLHQSELLENWKRLRAGKRPFPVPPLV